MKVDKKVKRESDYIRLHTLTEEDFKKLILEKYERAKTYNEALKKREELFQLR